jgi:hypothetical protein
LKNSYGLRKFGGAHRKFVWGPMKYMGDPAVREINCEDVTWIAMTGSHNNFDEALGSLRAV